MQKRMGYFIWSIALIMIVSTVLLYPYFPSRIAMHWNIQGEKDGFASPAVLFLFPFLLVGLDSTIVYALHSDRKQNKHQVFEKVYDRMRFVFLLMILFAYLFIVIDSFYPTTFHIQTSILCLMGVVCIIIGNVMPQFQRNKWMGFRTPWTSKDDIIWRKTHRIAGFIWFFSGIVLCAASFLKPNSAFWIMVVLISIMILVPIGYSYQLYRKRKEFFK